MSNKQLGKRCVLFVDTGDNCRCPMARGYLFKLLAQRGINHILIKTCGVMTPTGLLPTPETVQLLQEEGIDITQHRSQPMSQQLLERADLVLGMTPFHVQTAVRKLESCKDKTFLLKEFVGHISKDVHIHDPMGATMEVYRKIFDEIKEAIAKLVDMEFVLTQPEAEVVDNTQTFRSKALNDAKQQEILEQQKKEEESAQQRAESQSILDNIMNEDIEDVVSDEIPAYVKEPAVKDPVKRGRKPKAATIEEEPKTKKKK